VTVSVPTSGLRKAAILMVLLGEDAASEIYRHLPQPEVEQITQEITTSARSTRDRLWRCSRNSTA
jgi:flagellar motor switch protein FliG